MSLSRAVNVPRTCGIHVNPLLIGAARGSRHLGKVSHFFSFSYDFLALSLLSLCLCLCLSVPWCALWALTREQGGQSWMFGGEEEDPIPWGGGVSRERRRSKKVVAGPHRNSKYHSNTTFSLTYDAVLILCRMSLCFSPSFLPPITLFFFIPAYPPFEFLTKTPGKKNIHLP